MDERENLNVYEATKKRLEFIFKEFDNIYLSFSGGKDSGVMLNMVADYMKMNNIKRKIGVFHLDYEAQYQMTTDYVDSELSKNLDIFEVFRICLPLKTPCATSMTRSYWYPWDENLKDIWVRDMPNNGINNKEKFPFFREGMSDYDFQSYFGEWFHKYKKAKKTCALIGIRTQESMNRWRAIHSDRTINKYKTKYINKVSLNVYNAYPLFDWKTEDIWVANGKFGWDYNRLYDLYYQAGITIDKQRVASPFIEQGIESLKMYKVIDPNNWAKLIGRTDGVNFSALYGGTTAMGWRSIKLPEEHTWESYMYFLLETLPKNIKNNYLKKLQTSIEFWREKGGALSEDIISSLDKIGITFAIAENNYQTNKKSVKMEYLDDIDISEFKELPTFKRMCICIMKNDHLCKYMGFSQTKEELTRRKESIAKWENLL